jgi:hypothetical protein
MPTVMSFTYRETTPQSRREHRAVMTLLVLIGVASVVLWAVMLYPVFW